jgi:erythromycin esterase-like protein
MNTEENRSSFLGDNVSSKFLSVVEARSGPARLLAAMILAGAVLTACSRAAKPTAAQLDWLKRNVTPLATVEAGHGFADLQALKKIIGDARIVSLGESTHGNREIFQMKHRLVEYLAGELGFTILSMEANLPESRRLNDYVLGGNGSPGELIQGLKCQPWETQEVLALVQWMRSFNSAEKTRGDARRIELTGFDMQFPELAADIVRDFARQASPDLTTRVEQVIAQMTASKASAPVSTIYGALPTSPCAGHRLVFSGWIRTENMQPGWAGLWCIVYAEKHQMLFCDNMEKRGPRGTTAWQRFEISLAVPKETAFIDFGLLSGDGTAWFDDLKLQVDGQDWKDERFDFNFEGTALKGFKLEGNGWTADLDVTQPHAGKQSLRLRRLPQVEARAQLKTWTEVIADLESGCEGLAKQCGAEATAWALLNASLVAQNLTMASQADARKRLEQRDRSMADNVRRTLEQNPKSKIILWGHIGHLVREQGWMGGHLETMFPGQMKVLGLSVGRGECLIRFKNTSQIGSHPLKPSPPGSFESFFTAIGQPRFLIDLNHAVPGSAESGWLAEERSFRIVDWEGNEWFDPVVIRKACDVIIYMDRGTPAVPLKLAR